MNGIIHKRRLHNARALRVRAQVKGDRTKPRLHVFRSLQHISAQLIDDDAGKTLVSASEKDLQKAKGTKTERAQKLGELFGKKAVAAGFSRVVFDRGPYLYHGRIAAFAEAARHAGLKF